MNTDLPKKELDKGIQFVLADYDSRFLVIGSPNLIVKRLDLVLMDSPTALIGRAIENPALDGPLWTPWRTPRQPDKDPDVPATRFNSARLIESNGGKSIAITYGSYRGTVTSAIPITPVGFGVPKFISPSEMASLRVFGAFGIAKLGDSDLALVHTNRGRVLFPDGGAEHDLGLPAPTTLTGTRPSIPRLVVHNKQMSVLWEQPAPNAPEETVLHVWTPMSAKWTQFRVPGSNPEFKSIGSWVLGLMSSPAKGRMSPGQAEHEPRLPATRRINERGRHGRLLTIGFGRHKNTIRGRSSRSTPQAER